MTAPTAYARSARTSPADRRVECMSQNNSATRARALARSLVAIVNAGRSDCSQGGRARLSSRSQDRAL
jgi:hypothetical protein